MKNKRFWFLGKLAINVLVLMILVLPFAMRWSFVEAQTCSRTTPPSLTGYYFVCEDSAGKMYISNSFSTDSFCISGAETFARSHPSYKVYLGYNIGAEPPNQCRF